MSANQSLSARLKAWSAAGFGALVTIGCVLVLVAFLFFDKVFPFDAKRQNDIEQSIVKIDQLPPNFERVMASKIGPSLTVEYKNNPATLDIKIFKTENSPASQSAEQLLAQSSEKSTAPKIEKRVVGNEDLFYELKDQPLTTSSNMIGYVVPKSTRVPVRFETAYSATPFKMEEIDKFLQAIKGF